MKVLLVEDDAEFRTDVSEILMGEGDTVITAENRSEAEERIRETPFDIVILDLAIPTDSSTLQPDVAHGRSVISTARTCAPGTPLLVLTGSTAEPFIAELLAQKTEDDIWGEHKTYSLLSFYKKQDTSKALKELDSVRARVRALSDIELISEDKPSIQLSWAEARQVRIFASRNGGVQVRIKKLAGGLSESHTVRLIVRGRGGELIRGVGKLGKRDRIKDETDRYVRHVLRLAPGAYATLVGEQIAGAQATGAAFYRLADGYDQTLFELLRNRSDNSNSVVQQLRKLSAPWSSAVEPRSEQLSKLRALLLDDRRATECWNACGLDSLTKLSDFESHSVLVNWRSVHGDLHGGNILLNGDKPILIDFGRTGIGPASLDAITLELSLQCHPDSPFFEGTWRTDASGRFSAGSYGIPCEQFASDCRDWAKSDAAGENEVLAVAYSYLLRQVQYSKTQVPLHILRELLFDVVRQLIHRWE